MTTREKVLLAIVSVLLVLLWIGFTAWRGQHALNAAATAQADQREKTITQAETEIDQAKADQARTAGNLQAALKALDAEKAKPVTPALFVADLNKAVPNLPEPVSIEAKPETIPAVAETKATTSETQVVIPAADLPALKAYKIGCDENAAKLTACQLTAASLSEQLDGAGRQLKATADERDSWKKAAKGGSFWARLRKRVKCVAISGASAAVGALADKNEPARGAAIGAVAGGSGCELF